MTWEEITDRDTAIAYLSNFPTKKSLIAFSKSINQYDPLDHKLSRLELINSLIHRTIGYKSQIAFIEKRMQKKMQQKRIDRDLYGRN